VSTWNIDPAHTDVSFSAKHMMITTVRGKFARVEGSLELDEKEPSRSSGELRVDAASLSTGFDARDEHLRSADFFDAATHPRIVFRSTSVEPKLDGSYAVTGDVTIRGKGNRKDWGLNWNMALEAGGWLVGDEIKLEIDVAADEAQMAKPVTAGASVASAA
jgi:polyisoprenoid-binding protein YceI